MSPRDDPNVRLRQADDLRVQPVDSAQNLGLRLDLGVAHSRFQLTSVSIASSGSGSLVVAHRHDVLQSTLLYSTYRLRGKTSALPEPNAGI